MESGATKTAMAGAGRKMGPPPLGSAGGDAMPLLLNCRRLILPVKLFVGRRDFLGLLASLSQWNFGLLL